MATLTIEQLREYTGLITQFGGEGCPVIATLAHVDVEALTAGDDDPFFVTLQISEVDRVSKNGIDYDEYLVSTIEEALRQGGVEALMGHLPEGDLDTAFPHSDDSSTPLAGFWVGVMRVGKVLWGKAYIPPGKVREYIRRLKATKGKLGVSFFGRARVEELEDGVRRLRYFTLETLDFVPHNRASLTLDGDFEVTSEFEVTSKEGAMPTEITSINDVPQIIREKIRQEALKEAKTAETVQRVAELEQQVTTQESTIAEMREYGRIVTEISAHVGADVDLVEWVREINETMTRLGEMLGADVNIVTRIEEYHTQIQEIAQERFSNTVSAHVAELTNWQVTDDKAKAKLEALRQSITSHVVAQIGNDRTPERVAEVAQSVWDGGYEVIAEAVRDSLAGPGAFVGGKNSKTAVWAPAEDGDSARSKLGI